jgi:transcriptional regulator with XRE-family HTH domain
MARHENLREYLFRTRQTQEQLAKRLGVRQATVSRWVTGQSGPTLKRAVRLAKLADIPIESLIGGESSR